MKRFLPKKLINQLRLGVFGRAFLTLFLLLLTSLSAWVFAFLLAQQEPRATQIAERAITAYNITQRAFRFAPPETHPALLVELATIGDTQAYPREIGDTYKPLPDTNFWNLVENKIRSSLLHDPDLIIANEVNGVTGIWVSLQTQEGQNYWLVIRDQPFFTDINSEWVYWSLIVVVLSLLGSSLAAFLANKPLGQLSQTVHAIRHGEQPNPLPENSGPHELRTLFRDINMMVADRLQVENDRQVMLAGISHDLRTPLARMRLELEMCALPEASMQAIDEDLEQVNHCINQILEYSRPTSDKPSRINISQTLNNLCRLEASYTAELKGNLRYHIEDNLFAHMIEGNLKRVVGNLIENARRYGKNDQDQIEIEVKAYRSHHHIYIDVSDFGKGVKTEEIPRIMRPFSRGEQARTGVNGSGLGLAICERLLKPVGASLKLLPNNPKGLLCRIEISLYNNKNI
ncbi:MAG: ATP-binding protein [Pelistega sp.]|nr:ATP-binding protein [Pelistega sp.]